MAPVPRYYPIRAKPRGEFTAADWLKRDGWTVLFPVYRAPWRHARRRLTILRPFLPGYLFAMVEQGLSTWAASKLPGVASVMTGHEGPVSIPANERHMSELLARMDSNGVVSDGALPLYHYHPGDRVRLLDSRIDQDVEVEAIDNAKYCVVWLEILGGRTRLTVPHELIGEVVKISPDRRRVVKPLRFATTSALM
jgi:transcription antitermination factor NusG